MKSTFLALALVLLLPVLAVAATLTSAFGSLSSGVHMAYDSLPATGLSKLQKKQKAALKAAVKALDRDAADLVHTLTNATVVCSELEKGGYLTDTGSTNFIDDTTAMVVDLGLQVSDVRQTVVAGIGELPAAKKSPRTLAQALLDKADVKLAGVVGAPKLSSKLKLLNAALKYLNAAQKIVSKASGSGSGAKFNVTDGTNTFADTVPGATFGCSYIVSLDDADMHFDADFGSGPVLIAIHAGAPAVGTRPASSAYGAYINGSETYDGFSGTITGTITFTVWNPGQGKAKGSVDVTFSKAGSPDVHVTGTFDTTSVIIDNS